MDCQCEVKWYLGEKEGYIYYQCKECGVWFKYSGDVLVGKL